ncbi:MAG TPA: dihydrodipicolinate synthase family protein, partial [Pirellulaceae bacterium]|nr:dihydrodipicolinate synthase family protein [Pirellulaceae bacterium]
MPNPLLTATNRILPALVTPLMPSGELDVRSTERLIDHLYRKGVGGLYVTGSTGEGIYLDFDIRKRLTEIAVQLSKGRGNVIVHVGAIQAAKAIELADHAARIGADAVSSIPPFAGGYTWGEVHSFYTELARASRLPVIAYYIPGLTGQQRSLEELASLLTIPNIA